MLKQKLEMVEALGDIEIATSLLKQSSHLNLDEHPIDTNYRSLRNNIQPLDKESEEWTVIEKYVANTHAGTHNQYSLDILDIYTLERDQETQTFRKLHNRTLLWHGSRLSNWVGILSQGLRIAPPEAPVTGYM
jgi:hypothetical protein